VNRVDTACSADAVSKAVLYCKCGTAQADIHPTTSSHLGKLADEMVVELAAKKLQENAAKRREADDQATAAEAAAAGAADPADTACATQLHCSRSTAGSHDKLDFHGIAGVVCAHIFPALGLFLPMPTYEQHYFYDILFMALLKVGWWREGERGSAGADTHSLPQHQIPPHPTPLLPPPPPPAGSLRCALHLP
jgi:hypothetical protein